jgi:hypothetical protein
VQQARWRDECAAEHAQHALQGSVLGRWGWRLRRRRAGLSCQLAVVAVWAQRLRRRHTMRCGLERLRAAARRHEACVRAARRRLSAAALARLLRGWAITTEMSREQREAEEDRRGLAAAERVQLGVRARCWGGWVDFVEARRFEHEARSRADELWSKVRRRLQHIAPRRPMYNPMHHQAYSRQPPCALRLQPYVQVNGWLEELDSDAASLPPPPPTTPPPPRATTASSTNGGSAEGGAEGGSADFGSRTPLDAQLDATDLGRRKQVSFVYPSPTKEPAEAETCRFEADAGADAVLRSGVLGAYAHAVSPKQPAE